MDGKRGPRLRLILGVLFLAAVSVLAGFGNVAAMPNETFIRSVSMTNVTDTSFTVNWVTDFQVPSSGSLHYGPNKDNLSAVLMENTIGGALGDVHSITVSGLDASTTYYFTIQDASLIASNNGSLYSVTTGKSLSTSPPVYVVTGTVTQSDGRTPVIGALVTLRVTDYNNLNPNGVNTSAALSTLSGSNGSWSINFAPRLPDGSGLFQFNPNGGDSLLVAVEAGSQGNSGTHTYPLALDANGKMSVGTVTVAPGTLPTDTPVPLGGTPPATATETPTTVPTVVASPSSTSTVTPTTTPLVGSVPTATPIHAGPTAALPSPSPTPFEPSLPAEAVGESPTPPPTQLTNPAIAAATPVLNGRPPVATPITSDQNPPATPTPYTLPTVLPLFPSPPPRFQNPATATPRVAGPSHTAPTVTTPGDVSSSIGVTAVPPVPTDGTSGTTGASPLRQLTALFAGAAGLLGVGLVILAVGVVSQMRHEDGA